jgi:hypothetical protein
VIGLTKPKDHGKFDALVSRLNASRSGGPIMVEDIGGGWRAFADAKAKLDRYDAVRGRRKLTAQKPFTDAMAKVDPKAAVRYWVSGSAVQGALDRALERSGAPPNLTKDVGTLESIAGWARAENDGVRAEAAGTISPAPKPKTYAPSLASSLPKGALLYASFAHLDDPTALVLRLVGRSNPRFNRQLESVQAF